MNIVIIDDDPYKRERIKNDFSFLREKTFQEFESMHSGLYHLAKNAGKVDLLILDWIFPSYDGDVPERGMGLEVLIQLSRVHLPIPTIVCSSDSVCIPDEYGEFVIGTVPFDFSTSMRETFQTLIQKQFLERKNEHENIH